MEMPHKDTTEIPHRDTMEMPQRYTKRDKHKLDSTDSVAEDDPEEVDITRPPKVITAELQTPQPDRDMGEKSGILRLTSQLQVASLDDVAAFCKSEEPLNQLRHPKSELKTESEVLERIIIRGNGLMNQAMTSIHSLPVMSVLSRKDLDLFVFCMQNVGSLEIQKEGEQMVFNMWAFQHEETGQYLAVRESEGSWNLVLLPLQAWLSASQVSSPVSETEGPPVQAAGSSSVRPVEPGVSSSCPDCYKFLVQEGPESGGQTVAIIPLQLREANKSLGYASSSSSQCPVDVTDGQQACFQLKRVLSLSCDEEDDDQPPHKRQRITAKTIERPFVLLSRQDSAG